MGIQHNCPTPFRNVDSFGHPLFPSFYVNTKRNLVCGSLLVPKQNHEQYEQRSLRPFARNRGSNSQPHVLFVSVLAPLSALHQQISKKCRESDGFQTAGNPQCLLDTLQESHPRHLARGINGSAMSSLVRVSKRSIPIGIKGLVLTGQFQIVLQMGTMNASSTRKGSTLCEVGRFCLSKCTCHC